MERGEVNVMIPGSHIRAVVERMADRVEKTGGVSITRSGTPSLGRTSARTARSSCSGSGSRRGRRPDADSEKNKGRFPWGERPLFFSMTPEVCPQAGRAGRGQNRLS